MCVCVCVCRRQTSEPYSMHRVCRHQGRPRPTRISNTLLPMELEMAMSPRPEDKHFHQSLLNQSLLNQSQINHHCVCV